jgi:hypothetical protein
VLPPNVLVHRYKEPEKNNLQAPTVKTATVLGVLGLFLRSHRRDAAHRDSATPSVTAWDATGTGSSPTCSTPRWSTISGARWAPAPSPTSTCSSCSPTTGEVAADDPRVMKTVCSLGAQAVGQRLYVRATGPAQVELSVGPPGGEPSKGAPCWAVDLKTSLAKAI